MPSAAKGGRRFTPLGPLDAVNFRSAAAAGYLDCVFFYSEGGQCNWGARAAAAAAAVVVVAVVVAVQQYSRSSSSSSSSRSSISSSSSSSSSSVLVV